MGSILGWVIPKTVRCKKIVPIASLLGAVVKKMLKMLEAKNCLLKCCKQKYCFHLFKYEFKNKVRVYKDYLNYTVDFDILNDLLFATPVF